MSGDRKDLQELAALDDDRLLEEVKGRGNIPAHVAIIMDGNGRWAKRRLLPRVAGHRAGRHSVRRCLRACRKLGVDNLTLYTFSQENFKRPPSEVKALWLFLQESLLAEVNDLKEQGVRLLACGALEQLPDKARIALEEAIAFLADNRKLTLNLALRRSSTRPWRWPGGSPTERLPRSRSTRRSSGGACTLRICPILTWSSAPAARPG